LVADVKKYAKLRVFTLPIGNERGNLIAGGSARELHDFLCGE
jgi:hypothetical protein